MISRIDLIQDFAKRVPQPEAFFGDERSNCVQQTVERVALGEKPLTL
jgi:hypothetical protein